MEASLNYFLEGTGKTLVFQHGLTANVHQIKNLFDGINDIRLLCMDCPGHGASPLKESDVSFDQYTDILIQLMDKNHMDSAVIGGLSMGSGIALNMAVRYPDRVSALILLRPAWLNIGRPENLDIIDLAARFMNIPSGKSQFERTRAYLILKDSNSNAAKSVLGIFADDQQKELKYVIHHMYNDCPFSSWKEIEQIQKPCLILANHEDPLHPFDMADRLHKNIKGSTLKMMPPRYIETEKHIQEVRKSIIEFIKDQKL